MRVLLRALLASLLLLNAACPKRVAAPSGALEDAAGSAGDPNAPARTLAFAGFHSLLVSGDLTAAQQRFSSALLKDPADPYALFGELLLARRSGHQQKMLLVALDLVDRAPSHPLASAAARVVLDSTGIATSLDERILARIPVILRKGAAADTAILLRSAQATVLASRGQSEEQSKVLGELGMSRKWTLYGPLSAYSLLSFDEQTQPERDGALPVSLRGDWGPSPRRTLPAPAGRVTLANEGQSGDVYLLAVDAEVSEAGAYILRSVTGAPHKVYLDGTLALVRRSFEQAESTVSARVVQLAPGRHRILVRLIKDERAGDVSVSLARNDGRPAALKFSPAADAATLWSGVASAESNAENNAESSGGIYPDTADLFAALREEAGDTLAQFLSVRDGIGRDRDGARRLLAELPQTAMSSTVLSLRADANLADRSVPAKVSRGRAARDLEAALEKDPKDVNALLQRANLALDDGRFLEASELIQQARAAHDPVSFSVPLTQARVELGLGVDAQADERAREALKLQPGLCEALILRYDLARRRDAVAAADAAIPELEGCAGQEIRLAEHQRTRGQLAEATATLEKLTKRDPSNIPSGLQLVGAYVALKKWDAAVATLKELRLLWPRNATLPKRLGEVQELAGREKEALAAREEALLLDGSDLTLRRGVERAKTGKELLEEFAISSKTAISAYSNAPGEEDATGAYVLDAAAVRVYQDGTQVDRIHIIQKALDQSGVSEIAEVNIPAGAQVLTLRTLKADGTSLEPETFEHKETVSLPGVQVDDFIEYEFLLAHPTRGPAQPGFTAGSFYFQIANQPNNWSTYLVAAPKGTGMSVESHNMQAPGPVVENGEEIFRHEERRVPPYIPEPDGPPSANEFLPFVTVGAGATGLESIVALYSDISLDRAQLTFEVEQFAKDTAAGKTGEDAVKAIYAAVHKRIVGRDAGLSASAASTLGQDRGSRLVLLRAALRVLGFKSRVVAVRTFAADPAPYKFPNESQLPYVCLRVELPDGRFVWLDPIVRFAPYGELPEQAVGGRDAYLFPEPGLPLEKIATPQMQTARGKTVTLTMKLAEDGSVSGSGEERYEGFEAASLGEALDGIPPDQRSQALQQALSRYFGGADLSGLKVDMKREVGAPLVVRYDFRAPRFARIEPNGKMVLQPVTFPAQLGRRYAQMGSRRTPLYIDATEENRTVVTLELPKGYSMRDVLPEIKTQGPAGSKFIRREALSGSTLTIDETYRIEMARISTKEYEAFGTFAGEVDLVQTRDLLIEKK